MHSNCKWTINFQTKESSVSLMFSSCSPKIVTFTTDVADLSFDKYYNYIKIGSNLRTTRHAFNLKLDSRILVRVLEILNFKGSYIPFPSSGTKLTVSNIVNFDSDINVFDSSKRFQPNRIRLKSLLVSEYLEFDDFSYDFLDLTKEIQTPSLLNCSVTDSSNTCIRCIHGYQFSQDYSSCNKCIGFFVPSLNHCIDNASVSVESNAFFVSDSVDVRQKENNPVSMEDVKYLSFFGSLSPSFANTFVPSMTTVSAASSSVYKLTFDWTTSVKLDTILVPSKISLQYSGYSFLVYKDVDVITKPSLYRIIYEFYFSFSPSSLPQTSNFILSVPSESIFQSVTQDYTVSLEEIKVNYDDLIEFLYSNGNTFLPIEANTQTFVSNHFGPFHKKILGKNLSGPGLYLLSPSSYPFSKIVVCEENCKTCTRDELCLSCESGFFFDQAMKKCLACSEECLTCVDHPEKCTECKDGEIVVDQSKLLYIV